METYIGIIPASYESSRFTGKPLCDILGKSMIQRVYESVIKWKHWTKVYVATDNKEIFDKCREINIPCLMTRDDHPDCLDRAAEVVNILEKKGEEGDKYIIIQGNEPLFNTKTLDANLDYPITSFYTKTVDVLEKYDTNTVKVIISTNNDAIYFSRYSIPYHDEQTKRVNDEVIIYKMICVYSFTGEMLKLYKDLKPTMLETMEGIGLNRFIENGIKIHMEYTKYDSIGVGVPEDRDRVVSLIKRQYYEKNMLIDEFGNIDNLNKSKKP